MPPQTITFEKVDALVRRTNLAQFRPGGRYYFTARQVRTDPGAVIKKICEIYCKIRPILLWIKLILPKKWKQALETFIMLMDTLCPKCARQGGSLR